MITDWGQSDDKKGTITVLLCKNGIVQKRRYIKEKSFYNKIRVADIGISQDFSIRRRYNSIKAGINWSYIIFKLPGKKIVKIFELLYLSNAHIDIMIFNRWMYPFH